MSRMVSGTNSTAIERALQVFADMMIERMEQMKGGDWKKGWFNSSGGGVPQNLSGRVYNGSNSFFLHLYTDMKGFKTPVFMTFKQAHDAGASVKKGAGSFPVVYWDFSIKDLHGNKISRLEYDKLSKEEKTKYTIIPFMKYYNVFNLDQTTLKEVQPEKYQQLLDKFAVKEIKDTQGMYVNAALDRMFERQEWLCPVHVDKPSDNAYYSLSKDEIFLPMKAQFKIGTDVESVYQNGMEFYGTALHEMTHSTLTEERLNRKVCRRFGDPEIAKEELVAELSSALIGNSMGFTKGILDNNAAYLSGWVAILKEEPKFIVSVMADVNKASQMVMTEIDKQNVALGLPTLMPSKEALKNEIKVSSIYKSGKDSFRISGYKDGFPLGEKPVSKEEYSFFRTLNPEEKRVYLETKTASLFKNEIESVSVSRNKSMALR